LAQFTRHGIKIAIFVLGASYVSFGVATAHHHHRRVGTSATQYTASDHQHHVALLPYRVPVGEKLGDVNLGLRQDDHPVSKRKHDEI
jgi:hypothetical protein